MHRLLGKQSVPHLAVVFNLASLLLRVVIRTVYGTNVYALVDSRAVLKLMYTVLSRHLYVSSSVMSRKVKIAIGKLHLMSTRCWMFLPI